MGNAAAGLGAMAFWAFVAAVVWAGIWGDVRKRESQQETLRRVVESGKKIDQDVIERILAAGGTENVARNLRIYGLVVVFSAPGLAVLGWFLSKLADEVLPPLLGVSLLAGFVGIGLLVAARVTEQRDRQDQG